MSRSRGFTLIELLVVIAVIAILAALVMPLINSSIRSAERATCLSNTRQLYQAVMGYVSNWNSFYPNLDINYQTDWRWPTPNHCWNPVFNESIDALGAKVKLCPANDYSEWHIRKGRTWGIYSMGYSIYSGRSIHYYKEQEGTKYIPGATPARSKADSVMITDLVRTWSGAWTRETLNINNHYDAKTFAPIGGHCCFADGNARWTPGDQLDWSRYYQEYPSNPVDSGWTFCLGFRR